MKENSESWKESSIERERMRQKEEEKLERIRKAGEKRTTFKCNMLQKKITDCLRKLPVAGKRKFNTEEENKRRIDLKETKENLWKKWREDEENAEEKGEHPEVEFINEMEDKLEKLEEAVRKINEEEDRRENEKQERLQKKRKLEEKCLKS